MRRLARAMTWKRGGGMGLLLLLAPGAAWAGTLYVNEIPANVVSAERVLGYVLEDPLAQIGLPSDLPASPDGGAPERSTQDPLRRDSTDLSSTPGLALWPPEPKPPPRLVHSKAQVCRVRVNIPGTWWRTTRPTSLYGTPELCERVKAGDAVQLQVFGLATYYRFVSIRLGEEWFRLPLMRETRSKSLRGCLERTAPRSKAKKEDEDEPDLCGQMTHPRAL